MLLFPQEASAQQANDIIASSESSLIDDLGDGSTNNLDDSPINDVNHTSANGLHSAATENLDANLVDHTHPTGFHNGAAYREIQHHFATVNVVRSVAHSIPSQNVLRRWIGLYIHNIQPIIPMLHVPSLRLVEKQDWLLALAMSSLGCHSPISLLWLLLL